MSLEFGILVFFRFGCEQFLTLRLVRGFWYCVSQFLRIWVSGLIFLVWGGFF